MAPQLHSVSGAAQILGVSSRALWREVTAGNIPGVRVGRRVLVNQRDLEEYTFELARYMGTSVDMIDRTYGHLARGSETDAIQKLDDLSAQLKKKSERLGVESDYHARAFQQRKPLAAGGS